MEFLGNLLGFALVVLVLAGYWKVFEKAGEKGWKAIIPIYNLFILLRIVGKPWWWIFLLLIPFVNIIFIFIVFHALSKAFGKGGWYTVGLFFLSAIFVPILGFGESRFMHADIEVQRNEQM